MKISENKQGSEEWLKERVGKLSGTRVAKIVTPAKLELSKSREDIMLAMIDENVTEISADSFYKSDAMERGNEYEPMAAAEYESLTGVGLIECGLCLSDKQPLHACSPDRFTKDYLGGVEIKCSGGVKHLKYALRIDSIYGDYKPQCINYFLVNEDMQWLDTVSYRPEFYHNPIIVNRINRSDIVEDIEKVRIAIDSFFEEYTELFNKFTF